MVGAPSKRKLLISRPTFTGAANQPSSQLDASEHHPDSAMKWHTPPVWAESIVDRKRSGGCVCATTAELTAVQVHDRQHDTRYIRATLTDVAAALSRVELAASWRRGREAQGQHPGRSPKKNILHTPCFKPDLSDLADVLRGALVMAPV
jgi:hypothetical protein